MKTLLENGETVTLTQDDCGCVGIHDGIPHWLYMDGYWRTQNRALLARGDILGGFACAREEQARCAEKLRMFRQHHIAKLIPENENEKHLYC